MCWLQHEACTHFWLPSVHVAKRTSFGQSITTMVTLRVPWAQSWSKRNACKECVPGTQLNYRVCLTAVSLSLQQCFKTTHHNGPDVNGTISWQLLAELNCAETILSEVSAPTQHSGMYNETLSEASVTSEEISVAPPFNKFATDDYLRRGFSSHRECVTISPIRGFSSK